MKARTRTIPHRSADASVGTGQAGVSFVELVVIIGLAAVFMMAAVPAFLNFYRNHQLSSTTSSIQNLVRFARVTALKEKVPHRVLFHDQNAGNPNFIEVQRNQSGSFVTLSRHVYRTERGVHILGTGATNSLDSLQVNSRGECDPGEVYVEGYSGVVQVVAIEASCVARLL